jgi:hypothetical protein
VVEQRVGKRSADALVEQDEHQGNLGPLVGEAVKIALAIPLQEAVGFHFAEVVAELSKGISVGGQAKADENGLVDIGRAPSVELGAAVQQNLHEPHHARVLDLDAGDFGVAG